MSKARLTDYPSGATIRPGRVITYPSRQGNTVRNTEAIVLELMSDRTTGRIVPKLRVKPTGRDSGFIARSTLTPQVIAATHVVVIGDAPQGESK